MKNVEGMDVELVYRRFLNPDEMELHNSFPHDGTTLSVVQTYQLLLLREISQHRAAANSLHNRLASLLAYEHANRDPKPAGL